MADVYYLKTREGNYFEEQKDTLLQFINQKKYKKVCFLMDTIDKMDDGHDLGKALVRQWGQDKFDKFKKVRSIAFDDGQQFTYGTIKTLGFGLKDCDAVVHVYAYHKDILKAFQYTYTTDHILVYWVSDQPDLDEWVAILHGQNIGPTEDIQPISLDLPQDVTDELSRIRRVNVSNGGTHPMDEKLIKEVVQKVNKNGIAVNAPTFKAFLIHNIRFKPHHADKAAYKVRKYL